METDNTTDYMPLKGLVMLENDSSNSSTAFEAMVEYIGGYLSIISIGVGVLGNLLSVVIFTRQRRRDSASALYLGLLAVADTVNLSGFGVPIWVYQGLRFITGGAVNITKEMPNDMMCKFYLYVNRNASFMSAWLIVIYSMERCLAVWRPLHLNDVITTMRRKIAVTSLFVVSLLIWIPIFFMIELTPFPPGQDVFQLCTLPPDGPLYIYVIYVIGLVYVNVGIPLVCIVTLNTLIIAGIFKAKRELNKQTPGPNKNGKEFKCLVNLLLVSSAYFIFMTPFAVTWTIYVYHNLNGFDGVSQAEKELLAEVAAFTQSISMINYSLNFFIYTFTLEYYRNEIKRIFTMAFCLKTSGETHNDSYTSPGTSIGYQKK
jgi:hypothetical protein